MTADLILLLAVALCAAGLVSIGYGRKPLGWLLAGSSQAVDTAYGAVQGAWVQAPISGLLTLCCVAAWAYSRAKRPAKTQS